LISNRKTSHSATRCNPSNLSPIPTVVMNRLFGASSSSKPKPSLNDAIASTDGRIDGIQVKVKKLDGELARYRDQMKKMRPGPGKVREKQAMLTIS